VGEAVPAPGVGADEPFDRVAHGNEEPLLGRGLADVIGEVVPMRRHPIGAARTLIRDDIVISLEART